MWVNQLLAAQLQHAAIQAAVEYINKVQVATWADANKHGIVRIDDVLPIYKVNSKP